MKIYLICYGGLLCFFAFILLLLHIRTLKPFRSVLLHAALGLAALIAVNLTARFTGVKVPINIYSIVGSSVFGMPCVLMFLIAGLLL